MSSFFEKISKTVKSSARLSRKKRQRAQNNKIRNEKGEVITVIIEMQSIMRDYYNYLLWNGKARRNEQIIRKVQSLKTEPGGNRKYN